ncbi:pirin family protein [Paenibacillus puerhi]|uniref:pirin family protein n=1 Tax=Paenibacillus puerhi TaxID=2692622 RepID=UPI00135A16E6|nr:pirin family protein [Paenibacillus puerhi]
MIHIIPSDDRPVVDLGWLHSRPSFSFGEYYDPENTEFSVMRVCNDDVLAAGRGFGPHPHSDMEIVTIVLDGAVRHEDNLGNKEVVAAGQVQRMSAGSGLIHAEYNASEEEELRLLQLWFMPAERGLTPSFETCSYPQSGLTNALLPVVSQEAGEGIAGIHQDLTIYLSRVEAGQTVSFRQQEGRRIYVYAMEGKADLSGKALSAGDTARISGQHELSIAAKEASFLMLIDLP